MVDFAVSNLNEGMVDDGNVGKGKGVGVVGMVVVEEEEGSEAVGIGQVRVRAAKSTCGLFLARKSIPRMRGA